MCCCCCCYTPAVDGKSQQHTCKINTTTCCFSDTNPCFVLEWYTEAEVISDTERAQAHCFIIKKYGVQSVSVGGDLRFDSIHRVHHQCLLLFMLFSCARVSGKGVSGTCCKISKGSRLCCDLPFSGSSGLFYCCVTATALSDRWRHIRSLMAESRVIVEELLALCLQRITMEENSMRTEQGENNTRHQSAVSRSHDITPKLTSFVDKSACGRSLLTSDLFLYKMPN